ncbi:MAG TPA: HIT family protein [Acidimicrobiia bacterium]|nr:HIT family protein [Acidimicrobiia bacterium]
MATLFTRIIDGELPGRFVWRDDVCVAFLSINPLKTGHTLVVPRAEVDHWIDLDPDVTAHLTGVAQRIARAQQRAFRPTRIGLMIAGLEVPHVHLHLVPMDGVHDLDFANADPSPDPADLDAAATALTDALGATDRPSESRTPGRSDPAR